MSAPAVSNAVVYGVRSSYSEGGGKGGEPSEG